MAGYRGAHKRFNTRKARELAQSFFAAYPKLPFITLQQFHLLEKHKVSYPMMTIGLYTVPGLCLSDHRHKQSHKQLHLW